MDSVTFGGPVDRVLLLRTVPLFEGLGSVQLAAIAQHSRERMVARGSSITVSGGAGESVLLVIEGELETIGDGARHSFLKGDAVGFFETLARSGSALNLKARIDTMLLELDWEAQLDVCEEHFAIVMSYISFLASRLVERTQNLAPAEQGPVPLLAAQEFGESLDLNERLLLLSRSGAFSPGCLDALSELSHHAEELRLNAGEELWSAGQDADSFVLIASGALRLDDPGGRSAIYRVGTAAGMAESLSRFYRRFSATTTEPTVALRIQVESFLDILEDHFDLSLDVMATLARRLMALPQPNSPSSGTAE